MTCDKKENLGYRRCSKGHVQLDMGEMIIRVGHGHARRCDIPSSMRFDDFQVTPLHHRCLVLIAVVREIRVRIGGPENERSVVIIL